MLKKTNVSLLALGLAGAFVVNATADDSSALIDALVRKGVLKDKEAEQIRSQVKKDAAARPSNSSAGKINLDGGVKELKISGDVRVRDQWDSWKANSSGIPAGVTDPGSTQRNRQVLRLRLNADYQLSEDFFAGFGIQTGNSSISGNQVFANGTATAGGGNGGSYNSNYNIFLSRVFLGWKPTPAITLVAGKQPNPIYATDMTWDHDINPTGFSERINLNKMFGFEGPELTLVSLQNFVQDNNESTTSGALNKRDSRDAWTQHTQLVIKTDIFPGYKLTFAPGYYCANPGKVKDNGQRSVQTLLGAAGRDTLGDLSIITAPGDVAFKVVDVPVKFLWDFAYNEAGLRRSAAISETAFTNSGGASGATTTTGNFSPAGTDKIAYLMGFQVGQNKKKGDFSFMANYRRVGLSAVDPNLVDDDMNMNYTNMQGIKVGAAYNVTNNALVKLSYFTANSIRKDVTNSGAATGPSVSGTAGNIGATPASIQVLQAEVMLSF